MNEPADMFVDYDALIAIESNLQKIGADLSASTEKMLISLQQSQGFLAGRQFEKAKKMTLTSVELTGRTSNNLRNAMDFIKELRSCVDEYSMCKYEGDSE